jgi:heme-degrading monooxygenase HmoA
MIVELALFRAKPGAGAQLRDALRAARPVIARAPGYRASVFYQGVESPDSFVLRVEWNTLEDHMQGFRQGPLFAEWRSHFFHLLAGPPDMSHYEAFVGP